MFTIENATPKEEIKLSAWLTALIDELALKKYGHTIHVRLVTGLNSVAAMVPLATKDKRFYIQLNAGKPDSWLPGICHEMIHVEQVLRGDIVVADPATGRAYWRGARFNVKDYAALAMMNKAFYLSLPWEKEAHARMYPLATIIATKTRLV